MQRPHPSTRPSSRRTCCLLVRPAGVTFTAPSPPRSINSTKGRHWNTTFAEQEGWKRAARAAFTEAAQYLAPFHAHRIEVTFRLPVTQVTQADSSNFVGSLAAKGAQDGIVASQTLVPDDKMRRADRLRVLGGWSN